MEGKLPLEKRTLPADDGKSYPAINRKWRKDVSFVLYSPPPRTATGGDATAIAEEWVDIAVLLEEDLKWALSLDHHHFWSQVIFDETLQASIDAFLKFTPRHYDKDALPDAVSAKVTNLEKLYFLVLLRMSTHKETESHFITPRVFADIVYENYLFDVPKLIDVCNVFGHSNSAIVEKMVANIFSQQPRYTDDLRMAAPGFLKIFQTIQEKCFPMGDIATSKNCLSSAAFNDLQDIILYAFDMSFSLLAFLECYRPASGVLFENHLCNEVSNFYEYSVLEMEEALDSHKPSDFRSEDMEKPQFQCRVGLCKENLVKMFRTTLYSTTLQPLVESSGTHPDPQLAQMFVDTMTMALSQPQFLAHYNRSYPVRDDLDLLKQLNISLDDSRLSFLLEGITELVGSQADSDASFAAALAQEEKMAASNKIVPHVSPIKPALTVAEVGAVGGRGVQVSDANDGDRILLISQVKELFPELGDGFIEECLLAMDLNPERVINAILEDDMPASLKSADRQAERKKAPSPLLVDQRRCVFDNDEFDVFNRTDVDVSRMRRKKEVKVDDVVPESLRAIIHAAAEAHSDSEDMIEEIYNEPLYNDDYDDTYDGHEVGAADADSAEDFMLGRKVVTPAALRHRRDSDIEEELDSEEELQRKMLQEEGGSRMVGHRGIPLPEEGGAPDSRNKRGGAHSRQIFSTEPRGNRRQYHQTQSAREGEPDRETSQFSHDGQSDRRQTGGERWRGRGQPGGGRGRGQPDRWQTGGGRGRRGGNQLSPVNQGVDGDRGFDSTSATNRQDDRVYSGRDRGRGQSRNAYQGHDQGRNAYQGQGQDSYNGSQDGGRENSGRGRGRGRGHGRVEEESNSSQERWRGGVSDKGNSYGQSRDDDQSSGADGQDGRKHRDVKGKAKGQGQTQEVLQNRDFKDKHKSSVGNHNRKRGAYRKTTQGMF